MTARFLLGVELAPRAFARVMWRTGARPLRGATPVSRVHLVPAGAPSAVARRALCGLDVSQAARYGVPLRGRRRPERPWASDSGCLNCYRCPHPFDVGALAADRCRPGCRRPASDPIHVEGRYVDEAVARRR